MEEIIIVTETYYFAHLPYFIPYKWFCHGCYVF